MKQESKDFWINTGLQRLRNTPVEMITVTTAMVGKGKTRQRVTNVRAMVLDEHGSSVNDAGNRKYLAQEKKRIDDVFRDDYVERFGTEPTGFSYAVLDHVVVRTKKGNYSEKSLPKFQDYLESFYQNLAPNVKKIRSNAERDYHFQVGKMMRAMRERNESMYYFGGKGDAERMYFVRFHPQSPQQLRIWA